jgi:hypothetical protein
MERLASGRVLARGQARLPGVHEEERSGRWPTPTGCGLGQSARGLQPPWGWRGIWHGQLATLGFETESLWDSMGDDHITGGAMGIQSHPGAKAEGRRKNAEKHAHVRH